MTEPSPDIVVDLIEAFRRSKTMFAGVALGVFDRLEHGAKDAPALARELACEAEALERLLDALVALGLLRREGTPYTLTPVSAAYLCRSSPRSLVGYVAFSNSVHWAMWADLEGAVREGTHRWGAVFGLEGPLFSHFFRTEESMREFLQGMHGYGTISSPRVVGAFDLGRFRRLVDLGGATGHLAAAACRRYPELRAAVFDLPEVVDLVRRHWSYPDLGDRLEFVAGDFFADPLPDADLYSLGQILHDWTEEKIRRLLRRIHDRLPAGGALLLGEKLIDEDRSGPLSAHIQSLNMLILTEGRERTASEYETLLVEAGFRGFESRRTAARVDALLAAK